MTVHIQTIEKDWVGVGSYEHLVELATRVCCDYGNTFDLTPDEARRIATALNAAADKADAFRAKEEIA